jgi:hypothetical protein
MPVFMVERELPVPSMALLLAANRAIEQTARRLAARGQHVRHRQCLFIPDEARAVCLFEAETAELVREVNEEADMPFVRILEVTDLVLCGENSPAQGGTEPGSI